VRADVRTGDCPTLLKMHDIKIRDKHICSRVRRVKCRTEKCGTITSVLENARQVSMKSEQTHISINQKNWVVAGYTSRGQKAYKAT